MEATIISHQHWIKFILFYEHLVNEHMSYSCTFECDYNWVSLQMKKNIVSILLQRWGCTPTHNFHQKNTLKRKNVEVHHGMCTCSLTLTCAWSKPLGPMRKYRQSRWGKKGLQPPLACVRQNEDVKGHDDDDYHQFWSGEPETARAGAGSLGRRGVITQTGAEGRAGGRAQAQTWRNVLHDSMMRGGRAQWLRKWDLSCGGVGGPRGAQAGRQVNPCRDREHRLVQYSQGGVGGLLRLPACCCSPDRAGRGPHRRTGTFRSSPVQFSIQDFPPVLLSGTFSVV